VDVAWFSDGQQYVPKWLQKRNKHFSFPLAVPRVVEERQRLSGPYDVVQIWSGDACIYSFSRKLRHDGRMSVLINDTHGLEQRWWQVRLQEGRAGRAAAVPWRQRVVYPLVRLNQVAWSARLSDHMVCHTASDMAYVVDRGWVAAEKVTCIPHGVGDSFLNAEAQVSCQRGRGLLFVGTWEPCKGIHDLTEAFAAISAQRPGIRLSLLGTRLPEEQVLAAFPSNLAPLIRVVPVMSEAELIQEYLAHDIFLFPSLYEGFGMVLLEAMACGLPIVTTPVGGAPDVIDDGVDGFVVPSRDAAILADRVLGLLADAQLREVVGLIARSKAARYAWPRIANTYERLYECLIHEQSGVACERE